MDDAIRIRDAAVAMVKDCRLRRSWWRGHPMATIGSLIYTTPFNPPRPELFSHSAHRTG
jgi:hypothetical protein